MYGMEFCKIYNEFGWNYYPEAFGAQLLRWLAQEQLPVKTALDLGCGTGVLCEVLHAAGIESRGVDLSEDMIRLARERCADISYEAANMITYCPPQKVDLVTCTGDALNHLLDLQDIAALFRNVYSYLKPDGAFVFDILNESETEAGEPIEFDYSDTVKGQFHITKDEAGLINLRITVFENGVKQVEENIQELVHDPEAVCALLREAGFQSVTCRHKLIETDPAQALTWFVTARK